LAAPASNADVIAEAIVAAARAYGDDPMAALTDRSGRGRLGDRARRALPAAISALATQSGDLRPLARCLDVDPSTVRIARRTRSAPFAKAEEAAIEALTGLRLSLAEAVIADAPPEPEPEPEPEPLPPKAAPPKAAPPPSLAARTPLPGPIAAAMRAAYVPPAPPPTPAGSLRGQVLIALQDGRHTSSGMATRLGQKELTVEQTLKTLRIEGLVEAICEGPVTRHTYWRLPRAPA
jgi:hypothetical protein